MILGFFTYLILWWILLFLVLPWGVTSQSDGQPGWDKGAPKNPNLKLKFLITSVLAACALASITYLDKKYLFWGIFF